ncbi:MAG: hypothetical protein DRP03_01910 [Candidatus Aenigmatarchaeota archaeon]|nr:MAG: hypothetical protein DRP03_01910 [Candidatus Aenigmarchaeota archaeon]
MMKTKNRKQIIVLVGCILGGIVTGIIITAHHLGKTEGRIFPVAILIMVVGASIAGIIKYLVDKRKGINTTSKLTLTVSLCVIVGLLIGVGIGYHYFFKQNTVSYKVENCEAEFPKFNGPLVSYDEQNKTLSAEVWVNCCGVEVKVEKEGSTYKILERQVGELCRCMCKRKVTIFNVSEDAEVVFSDKDGNYYTLSPNLKFCGWSTYGKCDSDEDCLASGCSKQVCQSKFEGSIITTCEWFDCYNARKFNVACKCVEGRCQWTREQ